MKILHLAAIVVSMFFTLFVTNQAYAPCIEEPGINCNNYPPQTLSQIHFDNLNYETFDKPVITIVGVPSTAVHLEIDDSSSNIMFEHDLNLSSNGTARYILDISYYKSGGYSATATSLMSKVTTGFTVGMTPSGGNMDLSVDKNSYFPGDRISILGTRNSNTLIQLSLIDPYGTLVRSAKTFSDKTGHFSLSNFTIPNNAVSGIWQIGATSGVMHVHTQIVVNSTNNPSGIKTDKAITPSPLKQLDDGTNADQIKCNQGLQLIFKQENMSPICVKPDTSKILIARGWATPISGISFGGPTYAINDTRISQKENSTSSLKLYMSTDSDILKPGQPIGIMISVNNTLGTPVDIVSQNSWSYQSASTGPCFTIGYGVSILDGFYDANNMTGGKILNVFNPGILCPVVQETAQVYEFQPQSGNVKNVQCKSIEGMQCRTDTYQMGQDYKFDGYWDEGAVKPFKSGVYTIVGADEWGHVALDHFVVTNSTIFAGRLGSMSCPMTQGGIQIGATIKNSTGFAHYYNSEQYGTMFFLHPGETGTISVQYDAPANASWFQNNNNEPLNMTNGAALYYMADAMMGKTAVPFAISLYTDDTGHHSRICHYEGQYTGHFTEPCNVDNKGDIPPGELPYASKLLRSGIMTSFEPNSVMLYPGSTPVFTAHVSASPDVLTGTYWLSLERNLCGPGVLTKLVVLPSDDK